MTKWRIEKAVGLWWYHGHDANGWRVIGGTATWADALERVNEELELSTLVTEPSA